MLMNFSKAIVVKLSLVHIDEPVPDLKGKTFKCAFCGKRVDFENAFLYVQSISVLCPDCTEYFNSFNSIFRSAMIGNGTLYDFELDLELEEILNLKEER